MPTCRIEPGNVSDRTGAKLLLSGLKPLLPRMKHLWADGGYESNKLSGWIQEENEWELEIVKRIGKEFELLPWRWIVERTFAWLSRNRRLSKDYEWKVQTSETILQLGMIRLMLNRVAPA